MWQESHLLECRLTRVLELKINFCLDSTSTMLHVFDTIANVMEGDDKFDR